VEATDHAASGATVASMESHAPGTHEPRVRITWPCPRCHGSGIQQDTQRRCTKCVNDPGVERHELVELQAFKHMLRRAG
jgi:DnaJ-class molecular chaperone